MILSNGLSEAIASKCAKDTLRHAAEEGGLGDLLGRTAAPSMCRPVGRAAIQHRPPFTDSTYLRIASCEVREPSTVLILPRSASDLSAASTEPSTFALTCSSFPFR